MQKQQQTLDRIPVIVIDIEIGLIIRCCLRIGHLIVAHVPLTGFARRAFFHTAFSGGFSLDTGFTLQCSSWRVRGVGVGRRRRMGQKKGKGA